MAKSKVIYHNFIYKDWWSIFPNVQCIAQKDGNLLEGEECGDHYTVSFTLKIKKAKKK